MAYRGEDLDLRTPQTWGGSSADPGSIQGSQQGSPGGYANGARPRAGQPQPAPLGGSTRQSRAPRSGAADLISGPGGPLRSPLVHPLGTERTHHNIVRRNSNCASPPKVLA